MQQRSSPAQEAGRAKAIPAAPLFSRRFVVVVLALGFAAALSVQSLGIQAQSTGDNNNQESKETPVPEAKAVAAKPVTVKQSTEVPAKKAKTSIKAQSARNADSYEATEEISEDLSVSYPVDI
ncbi:hypothetical protein [Microbulbifer sp. HZ11]|uniref:hypothetical protein n=1 Tax=unclassified Microbulbifer TaxID=2619833 RepID=UPI0005BCF4EA|nr:hypothetical protein [Microbulbifer sp. HZ11]